jgi:hypothetical protein
MGRIAFKAREIGISSLHRLRPRGRAPDVFFERFYAAIDFAGIKSTQNVMRRFGSERVSRCHSTRYGFAT